MRVIMPIWLLLLFSFGCSRCPGWGEVADQKYLAIKKTIEVNGPIVAEIGSYIDQVLPRLGFEGLLPLRLRDYEKVPIELIDGESRRKVELFMAILDFDDFVIEDSTFVRFYLRDPYAMWPDYPGNCPSIFVSCYYSLIEIDVTRQSHIWKWYRIDRNWYVLVEYSQL